jgi:trk system potassium uptake protein
MDQGLVKFVGAVATYPARTLFAWYTGLVAVGTGLLLLPASRLEGAPALSFTDALFTATSAASVSGLMVKSMATDLSFTGQAVVLLLIQLGGLGILTIGTLLFVHVTGRQPVQFRLLTKETLGAPLGSDIERLVLQVVAITLLVEALGALALFFARLGDGPFAEVVWWAVFHAVSGFCNAGISLQDASLAPWSGSPGVVLTMAGLIIVGGLGFPVLLDLLRLGRGDRDRRRLRFHSWLVISATLILLVTGTLGIWLVERDDAFRAMPVGQAVMNAFFQSVTARSAGFETLPIAQLAYPTLFILMLLMFIGGGSCSTAGGIKVSTAAVLTLEGIALARRRWQVAAFGRRIPGRALATAMTVLVVYALVLVTAILLLLIFETHDQTHAGADGLFMDLVFEATSALGTVGLSTGVTGELGEASRLVLITLMLLGRVGPLAMASRLMQGPTGPKIRYPESEVIVG